ncbi:hypothetical protein [Flavobacterium pedocola]
MKTKFLLCATLLLGLQFQAQELSKPREIAIKGAYSNPVASPDGKYVLLTKEHNKGVYLLEMKTKRITVVSDKDGSGYAYTWNKDSKTFYYKEKGEKAYFSDSKVKAFSVTQKKAKPLNLNHNFLPSFKGNSKKVVHTNPSTLKIEATDLESSKNWVVTNDEGQFYNAILSNDGTKVAVHKGADIYLYNVDGNDKGKYIGTGLATAWSKDDKYLIGFLDESKDGHSVSNAEILLFDVRTSKTIKLTTTENQIEMLPSLYGNNQVIFSDEKTGKLFVSQLKF